MHRAAVLVILPVLLARASQVERPTNPPAPKKSTGQPRSGAPQRPRLGDDIVQLIDKLKAGTDEKGEFETTAEYEARRKAVTIQKAAVSFVVENVILRYDADASEMTVRLVADVTSIPAAPPTISRSADGSMLYGRSLTVLVRSILKQGGSYVGTNAFGAKRSIDYRAYDDYGVRLAPDSPINFNNNPLTDVKASLFTFSLDPTQARDLKPFLRVALVGTLTEPRVWSSLDTHDPTFSEPYETRRNGLYVTLRLEEVRILDSRSGEMVTNFTPDMRVRQ